MAKKLHYFDINGLGEPIRYIMHYSNQQFEDIRYAHSTWPVQEVKESLPYGQFPLYEEGDGKLTQSFAIARYVANKAKLVPSDLWEQALLDATALTFYDYWTKVYPFLKEADSEKKELLKKQIKSETIEFYFSRFEKELKSKNGYFAGKMGTPANSRQPGVKRYLLPKTQNATINFKKRVKLSWVDFLLVGFVEISELVLGENLFDEYPTVLALRQKIVSLPGVKEYIATRKPYSF